MAQIFMDELHKLDIKFATDRKNHFDTVAIKVKESGFSSADFSISPIS